MTAKRMRLLTAGLAIIALIAALFVINPGLGRSASAAWDGTAAAGFESGTGDSSDPYIIKTAEQLAFLAKQVNGGETYRGKYFQLEADLDLSGSEWTPIGTETVPFSGKFSGNGHVLTNVKISAAGDYIGLFGYNTGTITYVGIESGEISGGNCTGSICGLNAGTITGCYNNAPVTGKESAGGVCGKNSGTVQMCPTTPEPSQEHSKPAASAAKAQTEAP